ncbi:MAG: MFS transporter [Rhodovibrionaceae bacterium]
MTPRRAILCLALGETIVWAGLYYLFPALLPRWEAFEGWPKTTLTAAFAGAVIMSAVFSPLAGRLIDRGYGPQTIAGAAVLGAVLVALLPLAASPWMFAAIWLGIGVAMSACLYEPCFSLITRTRGKEARRGITLVTLVAGFAGTLSFPVNHAVSEAVNWQAATLTFAVLIAGVAAPLLWFGSRALERQWQEGADAAASAAAVERKHARPAGYILRHPAFWFLALGFALLAVNHGMVLNHLLPILHDRGTHPDTAVLAASMIGPMQEAGRLAMMAAERHVSSRGITTACFLAVIVATLCLVGAAAVPGLLVAFVILQGSGYGVTSIMKPVAIREILGDRDFGVVNGAMAVPYLIGFALAPFFGSLLWELGGYEFALLVVAGLSTLGLIGYRLAARRAV